MAGGRGDGGFNMRSKSIGSIATTTAELYELYRLYRLYGLYELYGDGKAHTAFERPGGDDEVDKEASRTFQ
jgi:hypothetical protein